jgi:hypothetical protein
MIDFMRPFCPSEHRLATGGYVTIGQEKHHPGHRHRFPLQRSSTLIRSGGVHSIDHPEQILRTALAETRLVHVALRFPFLAVSAFPEPSRIIQQGSAGCLDLVLRRTGL